MPPCGAAVFAFRQSIGRAVDIGERPLCGTPMISRYRPGAVIGQRTPKEVVTWSVVAGAQQNSGHNVQLLLAAVALEPAI